MSPDWIIMDKSKTKKRNSIDMTRGPLLKPLILFILPVIGGSVFQQLYNTVDFMFVGNYMDKTAAAAVGASATLIAITIGLFSGIATGGSIVAAYAIGEENPEEEERVLHSLVLFGIIAGLTIMALGMVLAPAVLRLLDTPASALPMAIMYLRIYLISIPMVVFYNMVSGVLRAEGDSRSPFIVLAVCGVLNVCMDFIFIAVLQLGIQGAATATVVTQSMSALFIGYMVCRGGRPVRLSLGKLRIDGRLLGQILKIGIPTGFQTMIVTFSNIMVQYYINGFGETAVAAFATYYKVENLIWLAIVAFGQAAVTFAGQNIGAGNFQRLRSGVRVIVLFGVGVTVCVSGLILLFPEVVFRWFIKDQEVMMTAISLAKVSFPLYFIYPFIEVYGGAVRALGHAGKSMAVVVANQCVLRVGLLAVFSAVFHSLRSLAAVYPITWATTAACFILLFLLLMRKRDTSLS